MALIVLMIRPDSSWRKRAHGDRQHKCWNVATSTVTDAHTLFSASRWTLSLKFKKKKEILLKYCYQINKSRWTMKTSLVPVFLSRCSKHEAKRNQIRFIGGYTVLKNTDHGSCTWSAHKNNAHLQLYARSVKPTLWIERCKIIICDRKYR